MAGLSIYPAICDLKGPDKSTDVYPYGHKNWTRKRFITTQANEEILAGPGYTFDANNTYSHVFSQSGIFTATVRASNNQAKSPIRLEKETITVN